MKEAIKWCLTEDELWTGSKEFTLWTHDSSITWFYERKNYIREYISKENLDLEKVAMILKELGFKVIIN